MGKAPIKNIALRPGYGADNLVGEDSATPTATSLMGRLKAVVTATTQAATDIIAAITNRPYVVETVSTINSITATVAGGGFWEAASWEDMTGINSVRVNFSFTAPGAANALILQWSHDGTAYDFTELHEINYAGANGDVAALIPKQAKFLRAKFLNGASSNDIVLVITKTTAVLPHAHPIGMPMSGSQLGALGMTTIIGQVPNGTYATAAFDIHGRLIVSGPETSGLRNGFAFGEVTTGATTAVPVRKTTLTEQASNAQRSIVSASANDTAAGTGARTVELTYFDQNCVGPYTEAVTLNGTTPVNTVAANICYVETLKVLTVGSGGANVGIISLKAATAGGGATITSIAVGDNRTLMAMRYVPLGNDCHVGGVSINNTSTAVGNGAAFHLRAQQLGVANSVDQIISDQVRVFGQEGQTTRPYTTPLQIIGPARIQLWVVPESGTSNSQRGSFAFYEEAAD